MFLFRTQIVAYEHATFARSGWWRAATVHAIDRQSTCWSGHLTWW